MPAPPQIVDCTLSGGTKTKCFSITIGPQPANMSIGPWCPKNTADGPEASGIWLEDDKVYDADGNFIANLSEFYKDDAWQMFDEKTGNINVTDTRIACESAARPNVDEKYYNYCVECQVSYMEDDASTTYIIPIKPVKSSQRNGLTRSALGIAFSGALI